MLLLFLFAFPLTVIGDVLHWNEIILFVLACLTILPLASVMGRATESIAVHSGPRVGGLLNATFGNAVELIIGILALQKGLQGVVLASLTGSIVGNLLLVVGLSFLVGGIRHPIQEFNKMAAGTHASMMMLGVVIALVIPTIFTLHKVGIAESLSMGVASITLLLYLLGLYFSLFTHRKIFTYTEDLKEEEAEWSLPKAIAILAVTSVVVGYVSEILVGTIETVSHTLGWSDIFIGVIIVALIGNAAEHSSAVLMAWNNRMDLSLEIALGSSLQVAMFVTPVLVFAGFFSGHPLNLVFSWPELAAMSLSVILVTLISSDGESNWLEGAMALGAYVIMGIGFYFL